MTKLDDIIDQLVEVLAEEAETEIEIMGFEDYDVHITDLSEVGKQQIKEILLDYIKIALWGDL